MNILSLVFSILLILSFGFYACFEKGRATRDIQKAFTSQASVKRALFRTYANEMYKGVPGIKRLSSDASSKPSSPQGKTLGQKKDKKPFKISLECSKINLYPLVEKGKEQDPVLHQTVIHFLRLFYEKPLFGYFSKKENFAEEFLDEWLKSLQKVFLKQPKSVNLEQIVFKDPTLQTLYYNMLRGAKNKYPSLLDFVKVQPKTKKEEKLCLKHASPDLLSIFFGGAANELFQEIHSDINALPLARIEELCRAHRHPLSQESLTLLNLILASHPLSPELTLLEEESEGAISLRKKTYRK